MWRMWTKIPRVCGGRAGWVLLQRERKAPAMEKTCSTRSAKMIKDEGGPSCAKWRRVAIFETSLRAGVERWPDAHLPLARHFELF